MAKFSIVGEETASEATKRIYHQISSVKHCSISSELFQDPGEQPRGSQGNLDCGSQYQHTRFDIRSCQRNDFCGHLRGKKCTYCEAAHLAFCRILQVDPETCKNLVSNLDAIRPERTRDIVLFSVRVAVNPNGLGDADYKKLKQHGIDDSEIIEIVAMAAFATYAITIAEALKLEVDKWT